MQPTISFSEHRPLNEVSIRSVRGEAGLYFIYLKETRIIYPFRESRLIYIGMSESKLNSIGRRLADHLCGRSGNYGLTNYIGSKGAEYCHFTLDFLTVLGISRADELEGVFLRSFLASNGSFPVCNNQCGIEIRPETSPLSFAVDWKYFD
jgi:hypothetical protein